MNYYPYFILLFKVILLIIIYINTSYSNSILSEKALAFIPDKSYTIIPCVYSTDNSYVYPTLVSITSLLQNAKKTFYEIYILHNFNLTEEYKNILKSVEKKYPKNCKLIFLDMGNKFQGEKIDERRKVPTYFRLELPNLLPNINKIIYLDGDTLIFEDLTELINIDMKDNYFYGFLDERVNSLLRFGIKNPVVLCCGVLLINLEALRKNNITQKFIEFLNKERERIIQHDQTIINAVCQGKLGALPPKYGIWNFPDKGYAIRHNKIQRPDFKYKIKEFINAYFHPAIVHFVFKPYGKTKKYLYNKWWDYAYRTGYYKEISNLYLKE